MPSAGSFRRFDRWDIGDQTDRIIDVGSVAETNRLRPVGMGFLRVGYFGSSVLTPIDAYLSIADDGTELGPIDVPLSIVVEEPVRVRLRPSVIPAAELRVVLSVTPVLCAPADWATRSAVALAGAVLLLPQWVRTVSSLAPATFVFRDRAGAPLSGVLTGVYQRPPLAFDVQIAVAGTVTFAY
jgi:hypothetical protein